MFKSLIKAAAIGCGVYLVGRAGECIGYCKGLIAGVRTAGHDPEWAAASAARWDNIEKQFDELKNRQKA